MSVTCDIIAIGASAGGVGALKKLVAGFAPDLPASVFITVHLGPRTHALLPSILNASGPLPASHPSDGEPIERGHIYVAPPDYHLLFPDGGHIHLGHGPKENMQRPSINAMFRSAAEVFGPRVVGVVLSGMLDDGAAGLWEIQQKGGLTLVQSPADALYRSMPDSAIRGLQIDYVMPVADMKSLWTTILEVPRQGGETVREKNTLEPSTQTCPACGGGMQRATIGHMYEYRCHTGHRFGMKAMVAEKAEAQERALVGAQAQTEELALLLEEAKDKVEPAVAQRLTTELEYLRKEAGLLRDLLTRQIQTNLEG